MPLAMHPFPLPRSRSLALPSHPFTPRYRYDIQDLHVNGVHPQLISVSESYIQVYDSSTS